jgi:hypothetical protein
VWEWGVGCGVGCGVGEVRSEKKEEKEQEEKTRANLCRVIFATTLSFFSKNHFNECI